MLKPGQQVSRKALCPCGSGRRYGKCCYPTHRQRASQQRFLYYFPMSHGSGAFGEDLPPETLECWERIKQEMEVLPVPTKVYKDSCCEREGGIPAEGLVLAVQGNNEQLSDFDPDWQLIWWLGKRNPTAILVPCESAVLMDKYRTFTTEMKEKYGDTSFDTEDATTIRAIIKERDLFIAKRINEDLQIGEVGVLFLGRLHNEDNHLTKLLMEMNIEVKMIDVALRPDP